MKSRTKIEWTDFTFNPWRGCTKVSPGCQNCYAETQSKRNTKVLGVWGPQGTRVIASDSMWEEPRKWNDLAAAQQTNFKVFCASLADVFEAWEHPMSSHDGLVTELAMSDIRQRLFHLIHITPNLTWLLLTKRPENILRMVPKEWRICCPFNVWLLTSVENQDVAYERIAPLLECNARVRGLSVEPMIGPLDLRQIDAPLLQDFNNPVRASIPPLQNNALAPGKINWVICGGESGRDRSKIRPMDPKWAEDLRQQCRDNNVPFFFKQWGNWFPMRQIDLMAASEERTKLVTAIDATRNQPKMILPVNQPFVYIDKHIAGRQLNGNTYSQFPFQGEFANAT